MRVLFAALLSSAILAGCAAPPSREIVVAMQEYAFLPSTIAVHPGERVRITVRNQGRLEHDFAPDQRGTAFGLQHVHLAPGQSASQDWTAPLGADEVQVVCTIATPTSHSDLGMVGRIVIR